MRKLFLENSDNGKYCLRKISGAFCILAGIAFMFTKLIFYMVTYSNAPLDGRGTFLVGTGAALLGITSFDSVINNIKNKGNNNIEQNM